MTYETENEILQNKLQKCIEALEWYASEENNDQEKDIDDNGNPCYLMSNLMLDGGDKARKTLQEIGAIK